MLNVLTLRTNYSALETHRAAADAFIELLTSHEFTSASAHLGKSILWFGESIPRSDWIARCTAAFANTRLAAQTIGDVSQEELRNIPSEALEDSIDGPLEKTHQLHLYQLCRNDIWVSVGILTAGTENVAVERVLDLRRLKQLAVA